MLLKAICTMSYLTESHPRPHHMTWKLITMREKHLWRTTFSLTFSFAFDSCLVAKPNIRTRSVDCTGKRITRRLSIKKYGEVWVKSYQLVVWVRFRSDTTEASSGAIFFAYLSLFPVSTLDIYPSNPKLVASMWEQCKRIREIINCREQGRGWYYKFSTIQKSIQFEYFMCSFRGWTLDFDLRIHRKSTNR